MTAVINTGVHRHSSQFYLTRSLYYTLSWINSSAVKANRWRIYCIYRFSCQYTYSSLSEDPLFFISTPCRYPSVKPGIKIYLFQLLMKVFITVSGAALLRRSVIQICLFEVVCRDNSHSSSLVFM